MEIFDLFFWFIGRLVYKVFNYIGVTSREMSDGGYTTLGFFSTCAIGVLAFIIWGVTNV